MVIRARVGKEDRDVLDTVALALAHFLHLRCPDPNPSGSGVMRERRKAPAEKEVDDSDSTDTTDTTLIPDKEYSVKQASAIARLSPMHLRKLVGGKSPKLPSRLNGRRRTILGKDRAHYMSRESAHEEASVAEA